MSTAGQNDNQLQLEIQHELITANQLISLISKEINQIKNFTSPGGELESSIKHSASLTSTLAKLQQLDLDNIPPIRRYIDLDRTPMNQNQTQQENTQTNNLEMDDTKTTLT